jgi:hypothetical protein
VHWDIHGLQGLVQEEEEEEEKERRRLGSDREGGER